MPATIGGAIAAVSGFLGSTAVAIGGTAITWGTILKTTASVVSLAASLGRKPPESISSPGRNLTVNLDANAPRQVVYGRAALAGHRTFVDLYADNQQMGFIYSFSQGACVGLHQVILDDTTVTLSSGEVTTAPWANLVRFEFENGASDATAFSSLASKSAYYDSTMRGRGIAKAFMEVDYDEDMLAGGFPQALFVYDGVKVYDPRKDSTHGGSGSHRFDDPTTWDGDGYDNPALQALHFIGGIIENGQKVFGLGVPASLIDFAAFAAAADVCDATVEGGKRYTAGGVVRDDEKREHVLDAFGAVMGGAVWESAGVFTCYAGAAQASVMTLTDDDLAGGIEFLPTPPFRSKVNTLRGKFVDPARDWRENSTAPVTDAAYVTEDGGETISDEHAVMLANSQEVIHRLTRLELANRREPRTYRARWKPKTAILSEGDCVTVNSSELGVNEKARVIEFSMDRDGFAQMTLRTETDAKYTAADDFSQDMPEFGRIDRYDPRETISPDSGDWSRAAFNAAEGEANSPAIEITGGSTNPLVRSVVIEYRRDGDTDWTVWAEGKRASAMRFLITGLGSETAYEAAVSYRNPSGVLGSRLVLGAVTTGQLIADDATKPSADFADLLAQLDADAATAAEAAEALINAIKEDGTTPADVTDALASAKTRLTAAREIADDAQIRTERLEPTDGNLIFDPALRLGPQEFRQIPGAQPFTTETAQGRALLMRFEASAADETVRATYKGRRKAVAGEVIEISAEMAAVENAKNLRVELVAYNAGGTAISTQTLALTDPYVRDFALLTLPANTAEIEWRYAADSVAAGTVEATARKPVWRKADAGQVAATPYDATVSETLSAIISERIASARAVSDTLRLILQNGDLLAKYEEAIVTQLGADSALVGRVTTLEAVDASLTARIELVEEAAFDGELTAFTQQLDALRISSDSVNAVRNADLVAGPDDWSGSPNPPAVTVEDSKRALVYNGPAAASGEVARWRLETPFKVRSGQVVEISAALKASGVITGSVAVVWFDTDDAEGSTVELATSTATSFTRVGAYDATAPADGFMRIEIAATASGAGDGRLLATEFVVAAATTGQSALSPFVRVRDGVESQFLERRRVEARQASFERHLVHEAVGARALISEEASIRASGDQVQAQRSTEIETAYQSADAAEASARAAGDAALQSQVNAKAAITYVDSAIAGVNGSIASTASNIRAEFALADANLQTDIDTRATITALNQAVSDAASARATQFNQLTANYEAADASLQTQINNRATVTQLNQAVADEASARAAAITSLTTTVDGVSSTASTALSLAQTVDGKLDARWGVQFDAGGRITSAVLFDDGTTRGFNLAVDVFTIEGEQPFSYDSGTGTLSLPNVVVDTVAAESIEADSIKAGNLGGEKRAPTLASFQFPKDFNIGQDRSLVANWNTLTRDTPNLTGVPAGSLVTIRASYFIETWSGLHTILSFRDRLEGIGPSDDGGWVPRNAPAGGNALNQNDWGTDEPLPFSFSREHSFIMPSTGAVRGRLTVEPFATQSGSSVCCHQLNIGVLNSVPGSPDFEDAVAIVRANVSISFIPPGPYQL